MTGAEPGEVLAIVLTESILAAACGGKTWTGAPELPGADEVNSPTVRRGATPVAIPRYLDGDWLAADGRMRPVADALTDLLDEVLRELGVRAPVPSAVVGYPTRWGAPTRSALESAVRARTVDAMFAPVAAAAATAYVAGPGIAGGFHRLLVLEADVLGCTVTCLSGPGAGPWRIDGCAYEPTVGAGDDAFVETVTGLAEELVGTKGVDATLVVGALAADGAESLRAQLDRRLGSPVLRELDGPELVHALPGVRSAEPAPRPDPAPLPPVTRLAPARWLDTDPHRPLRRDRRGVAVVAAGALLATAGAAVFWLRTDRDAEPSAATVSAVAVSPTVAPPPESAPPMVPPAPATSTPAEPDPDAEPAASGVRLLLPPGWQRKPGPVGVGRVELVPAGGAKQRIIVVRNNLAPGAGYDEMVAQLSARIAGNGESTGDLRRDVEFGGRRALAYTEHPTDDSLVSWHVLVERDAQLSVGCQYLPGEWDAVAGDCERVVRTVGIDP